MYLEKTNFENFDFSKKNHNFSIELWKKTQILSNFSEKNRFFFHFLSNFSYFGVKITFGRIWRTFWILKFSTFSEQKKINLNSFVGVLFVFLVNLFFSVTEFFGFETKNRLRNYKKPLQTILHRAIINYSFIFSRKLFVTFVQLSKCYF